MVNLDSPPNLLKVWKKWNEPIGYVDMGPDVRSDNDTQNLAKECLVFMAVGITSRWKLPLGYFAIDSIGSEQQGNLLQTCFSLLYTIDVKTASLTLDGAASNISMCKFLGAKLDFHNEGFQPWFPHPEDTNERVYVFLDPCHMLKLVRNAHKMNVRLALRRSATAFIAR